MHWSSSSPRGGPRAVGGGIGDFVGAWKHIYAPIVGEMKGLCFITPQTTEKYGDLASAKVQGNCEQAFIVCSQPALCNIQGPVVQEQVNANLGIKVNQGLFLLLKSVSTANFESQFESSQRQNFGENESTGIHIVKL